jgi:L-histidine N-alpha-methyltransferase
MQSNAIATEPISEFAADVRAGLTKPDQKELPSKYLYDALGSKLFEAICELPEYGLTRADERLLRENAREISARIPGDVLVCELGSGSGRKTRWILEALARRRHISYFPIEISPVALAVCRRELSDLDSVGIVGLEREYLDGLLEVAARRTDGQRLLVLFLGSTIGNFSPPADVDFLRDIRRILRSGDTLLLGTDLVKPLAQLMEAYDDPLGVTAAFNLNILARMNRELNADFALSQFEHHVTFNSATSSVEMHLRSLRRQSVAVPKAFFVAEFDAGETIWTENCHKFSLEQVKQKAQAAGFEIEAQWIDHEWPFAESLLAVNVE